MAGDSYTESTVFATWPLEAVGDHLAAIIDYRGKTPPKSPHGIPTLTAANIKDGRVDLSTVSYVSAETYKRWTTRGFPQPKDVLITTEAPVGEVAPFPSDRTYLITRRVIALRGKPNELDNRYLLYALMSPRAQDHLASRGRGSTVPRVLKPDILGMQLPIPPIEEQRAIAHILGTLDDKIELNRRMSQTLEATARALFKSWFVDFEPVRAKAEGRDTGMPDHITRLFPDAITDHPDLGEIPDGSKACTVDAEFELTMGQSPPGSTYNENGEGSPFYQGRTDFGTRFPTRRVFCTAPTRLAKAGDTLITVRAPVGEVNMAWEDCAIGRGVAAARHKTGSRFYTLLFMRGLATTFERFEGEGTVFGSINKRDFHTIPCVAPPAETVRAFESLVSPLSNRLAANETESRTLAALRDALLPKLISGELRLDDPARILGKAC